MERSGFFDANLVGQEYDRVYLSNDFASYFASFIGNGVFGGKSDELQVVAMPEPEMQIMVKGGQGWINGYWYENNDEFYLPVKVADGIMSRIDSIVLRLDLTSREIHLVIKEGTLAFEPVVPELKRSVDCYELQLATIEVPAGAVNIRQINITDTRLDTEVCGFVCGLVQQFDTTEFGKQLETFISDYIVKANEDYKDFKSEMQSLLDELEKMVSDDMVGLLATRMDNLEPTERIAQIEHGLNSYIDCKLYEIEGVVGTQGAGEGPAGGGPLVSIPCEYIMSDKNNVVIKTKKGYGAVEEVIRLEDKKYIVVFEKNAKSVLIVLNNWNGGERL